MNSVIEEYANLNDIVFGICSADDLTGLCEHILDIPFNSGNFRDRISPGTFLSGAKSVIVLGAGIDKMPVFNGIDSVMAISMSGQDYHKRLNDVSNGLVTKMLDESEFNYKIQIDSGPLIERSFALKSGLGFIGNNRCIITNRFGSFFNIALIVVDIEIEPTAQLSKITCEGCNKCTDACPTKALDGSKFDYSRCISYLTQKKGCLTDEEISLLKSGASIYGCDICQNACLHNSDRIQEKNKYSKEYQEEVLTKICEMSSKQFSYNFKDSNLFWRGKSTIQRNCKILLQGLESLENG